MTKPASRNDPSAAGPPADPVDPESADLDGLSEALLSIDRLIQASAGEGERSPADRSRDEEAGVSEAKKESRPGTGGQYHHYEGRLSIVGEVFVSGWIVDLSDPDTPLEVSILIDGETIGVVKADQPRSHLATKFKSAPFFTEILNVNHGLSVLIPRRFFDGRPHALAVTTLDSAKLVKLREPFVIPPDKKGPELHLLELSSGYLRGVVNDAPKEFKPREILEFRVAGRELREDEAVLSVAKQGEDTLEFTLTPTRKNMSKLLSEDLCAGLAGENGLGSNCRVWDKVGFAAKRHSNGIVTVTSETLVATNSRLRLSAIVSTQPKGGTAVARKDLDLSAGSDEIPLGASSGDQDLWLRFAVGEDGNGRLGEPIPLPHRLGELLEDCCFQQWMGDQPKHWTVGSAVTEAFRSFFAFSPDVVAKYGLSGDTITLVLAGDIEAGSVLLRQKIGRKAIVVDGSIRLALMARASGPVELRLDLKAGSRVVASAAAHLGDGWTSMSRPAQPGMGGKSLGRLK